MQIATTNATPPRPNQLLWTGSVYNNIVDHPRGWLTRERVYRGAQVGLDSGYGSLGDAVRAAKYLSGEERRGGGGLTAIAIVRDGARYLTYTARTRELSLDGTKSWDRGPLQLGGTTDPLGYRDIGRTDTAHAALRAFVDGAYVQFVGRRP